MCIPINYLQDVQQIAMVNNSYLFESIDNWMINETEVRQTIREDSLSPYSLQDKSEGVTRNAYRK